MANKTIFVYEGWSSVTPKLLGTLYVDADKRAEHFSFEYDERWLKENQSSLVLDPDLQLYKGRQYTPIGKELFGLFADSCPDRWGRLLMQRREAIQARHEGRKPVKLQSSDYLLGVYDEARMGALRFALTKDGKFESSDQALATPPWVTLRKLETASLAFENGENDTEEKWLSQLLAPGSSLGGARPKATIQNVDGSLWIAKFPSKHDTNNSGAWEKVAHDLAKLCGLNVPEAKLETFSSSGSTFIVKRFDRAGSQRIHFCSAMTLLGKTDGDEETSYLDIASFIKSNGSNPRTDLYELWQRLVFSMAITNTDDHLRNHGFIYTPVGWRLSPLYDVNPVPYGDTLSLLVDDIDATINLDTAIATAPFYGIDEHTAREIANNIITVIRNNWGSLAKANGLHREAIEKMRPAFQLCGK